MSRFMRMRRSMAVVLSLVLAAGPAGSHAPFLEAVYAEETRDAVSAAEASESSVAETPESSAAEASGTPAAENTETAHENAEIAVTEEPDTSEAGTEESDDSEEEKVPEQTSDSVDPESTAASEEATEETPEEATEEASEAVEAGEEAGEEIDPDEEILSDGSESEEEDLTSELPEVSSIKSGVPYINENKEAAAAADCVVVEQDVIKWKEINNKKSGVHTNWYVVEGNVTIDSRVVVNKRINLILADGAVLTIPKGIQVNRSSTNELHIYVQAEGTGRLVAGGSCEVGCAGLGGGSGMPSAPIYIHGGTITATGGQYAAGIGGGLYGDGTNINIEEGDVTAVGGSQAAGIGGGYKAGSEALTISGGTITAVAGETIAPFDQAAQAIGTGQDPSAGSGEISFILYEGAELHAGTDADNTQVYLNDEQGIQA